MSFRSIRFVVSVFAFLCGIVALAQGQTPRVFLKFDNNLTDSSGAGIISSVTPSTGWTPTYATDRKGTANGAIVFSSGRSLQLVASALPADSNQALGLRNAAGTNTSFTLAAWVAFDAVGSGQGYHTLFGNMTTSGTPTTDPGVLHAGLNLNSDKAHFGFNNGNDVNGATAATNGSTGTRIWYHLAFVYDTAALTSGGGTAPSQRIYINGVPEVTRWSVTNTLKAADLFLGNWGTATDTTNDLRGLLDDVVVYNTALKADQIQALFNDVNPNTLPVTGTYSAPKLTGVFGTAGQWGVREIKGYSGISYGTLVNADRIIRAYPSSPSGTKVDYFAPFLNMVDPDGAGTAHNFTNDTPLGTNTAAADDNILMIARCAVRIPAAGNYTFGFRGDDGSRLRVIGRQFASSTRIGASNVADPAQNGDGIFYPGGGGDTHTLGVVNFTTAGDYALEYTWWEGGGGAALEVFAAPGSKTSFDGAFQLIGNAAAGGLEIVRDPEVVPAFTANSASTVFVHGGTPSTVTLNWAVTNPTTALTIDQGIGAVASSGSQVLSSPATTTTYTLTATTPAAVGNDVSSRSVTIYVNSAPVISSFTASDTTVVSGAAVTLNWAMDGATSLLLQPGNINVTGQTSRVVNPASTTTYILQATNASGTSQQQVTVNVAPAPTITSFSIADPTPLYGAETSLAWTAGNFTSLAINQGIGTVVGTTGSVPIFPLQTTTYTLTATNDYGSTTANATVTLPVAVGVNATGFSARRVSSTVPFPFAGQGYLQSAISLLGGQNAGATTTSTYTTINFADGAEGNFTGGNSTFPGGAGDNFAVEITGTLVVNSPGTYTFVISCDDGARLRVDGQDIIVDDGTHAPGGNSGTVTLTKPTAQIQLIYYDATGGASLEFSWIRPNLSWQLVTTTTAVAPIVRNKVMISEFMAENKGTLLDEDGVASDWIEIWNSTTSVVNLSGYYLTDDPLVPNKWAFPAWTLGADKYLVVFASQLNRKPAQATAGQDNPGTPGQPRLHTDFKLATTGEYLALTRNNGAGGYAVVTEFAPTFPVQKEDVSYGSSDAEGYVGLMEVATPGATNDATVAGFVADTTFSHARGRYSIPFDLTIATATLGATIRYTTDGSTPTATSGTAYSGPIPISGTKVIRAAAFKPGWKPANVDTQTYLFVDDIATQTPATATALGFPGAPVNSQILRYGVNLAAVTAGGGTLQSLKSALAGAPSVCLTTDIGNLTNASTGIYVNSSQHGLFWERPVSVEYVNTAGTSEFQIDAGMRIRGGFSRTPSNPKHAFHLYFRKLYEGDLKYRLFGSEGATQFDQIDLRCEQNYSWGFQNNSNNALAREEWSRMTQRDMGQPYSRNRYFHLYINGIYWGVFNFEERTEASFGETYLGGAKDNMDVVKSAGSTGSYSTEMTDGNWGAWQSLYKQCIDLKNDTGSETSRTARYMQMRGLNADGTRNSAYSVLLDVDNLADYMLAVFFSGSWDSPVIGSGSNNWFCIRDRAGTRGFAYFAHDQEHGMDAGTTAYNRVGPWGTSGNNNWGQAMYNQRETLANTYYSKSNPHYVHELLCFSAEYRQRFADRVHRHFFNGGALTTAKAVARVNELVAQVDPIIHAEAARWGSTSLHRTTWLNAKNNVINFVNNGLVGGLPAGQTTWTNPYPTGRNGLVLAQLQGYQDPIGSAKSLFPSLSPPVFTGSFGGSVASPHAFQIQNPNGSGVIYYSKLGIDPRPIGGDAPTSPLPVGVLTGSSPLSVSLTSTTTVTARVYDSATGTWSALTQAEYLVGALASASNLVISKLHYNPPGPSDATQFVEVMNIGATTIDLTNVKFLLGLKFTFPDAFTLAPGARALIVRNLAAFTAMYPDVATPIAGVFEDGTSLDKGGEQLQLVDASNNIIRDFVYDNNPPWPELPDGDGPAMVLIRPETNPDHGTAANWRASAFHGGSPGTGDGATYAGWAQAQGIADLLGTGDDDGDGLRNLAEYGLGTNPKIPGVGNQPVLGRADFTVNGVTSEYLTLTVTRPVGRDDLTYAAEGNSNLTAIWSQAVLVSAVQDLATGVEVLIFRHAQPVGNETQQFMRLRLTRQP
jgi:hypothetical protein